MVLETPPKEDTKGDIPIPSQIGPQITSVGVMLESYAMVTPFGDVAGAAAGLKGDIPIPSQIGPQITSVGVMLESYAMVTPSGDVAEAAAGSKGDIPIPSPEPATAGVTPEPPLEHLLEPLPEPGLLLEHLLEQEPLPEALVPEPLPEAPVPEHERLALLVTMLELHSATAQGKVHNEETFTALTLNLHARLLPKLTIGGSALAFFINPHAFLGFYEFAEFLDLCVGVFAHAGLDAEVFVNLLVDQILGLEFAG
ncbi:uncharacterized protein Pyn_03025 [Prunus yedoensis var. nudiflora]|uniref:Uncharacterized protein n=1 Tax=Prunus yedoensis var. nudiflora TaxID=2094558 RepID=A0A314ZKZ5_PRUYE|nr:uncharacterized protein Pyn_03025 [Prunus yedoensis var. nudiflora]